MNPLALLRWTIDLLLLRGTPADAPKSTWLLAQLLALDLIASVFYLQAMGGEIPMSALLSRMLLRVAMIYGLLWIFGRQGRFLQTTLSLYAASALLTFVLLPIAAALVRSPTESADFDVQLLRLGFLSLLLWSIVVDAHIYRHAVNLKFWFALPLSLLLFMLFNELASAWFPFEQP